MGGARTGLSWCAGIRAFAKEIRASWRLLCIPLAPSLSRERFDLGWIGNSGCKCQGPYRLEESGDYALEFVGGDGGIIEATTGLYRFVLKPKKGKGAKIQIVDVSVVGNQLTGSVRYEIYGQNGTSAPITVTLTPAT